jgi:hypothetical protein
MIRTTRSTLSALPTPIIVMLFLLFLSCCLPDCIGQVHSQLGTGQPFCVHLCQ